LAWPDYIDSDVDWTVTLVERKHLPHICRLPSEVAVAKMRLAEGTRARCRACEQEWVLGTAGVWSRA
jgi:hypothetical protein